MKTKFAIVSFAVLAIASSCKKESKAPEEMTPTVDVAEVVTDSVLLSKTYPGSLSASRSVDIVGRVNGYLISQNYTDGDMVQKGQILFQIEPTQYQDAVAQAKAALETAESQYSYASRNYEAMKKALESDAVSQMEVLQAQNAMESAKAQISTAKAELQTAQTNLGYCTVRAPFSGMMTKGSFAAGAYISGAGAPVTLAKLYDNSKVFANFYIDDAAFVRSFADNRNRHLIDYDNVPVNFGEPLPHSYTGKLDYISPDIETSTGSIMLRVDIDSPYGELRDGMYATIDLPYALDPHAVLIKDASISTSQSKKFIYVVNDSNKVVYTPIEIGDMANDSMRIVTSGLKGNEKYVTKALLKVRPGMTVNPVLTK